MMVILEQSDKEYLQLKTCLYLYTADIRFFCFNHIQPWATDTIVQINFTCSICSFNIQSATAYAFWPCNIISIVLILQILQINISDNIRLGVSVTVM